MMFSVWCSRFGLPRDEATRGRPRRTLLLPTDRARRLAVGNGGHSGGGRQVVLSGYPASLLLTSPSPRSPHPPPRSLLSVSPLANLGARWLDL